jgi:hypothetical protein
VAIGGVMGGEEHGRDRHNDNDLARSRRLPATEYPPAHRADSAWYLIPAIASSAASIGRQCFTHRSVQWELIVEIAGGQPVAPWRLGYVPSFNGNPTQPEDLEVIFPTAAEKSAEAQKAPVADSGG